MNLTELEFQLSWRWLLPSGMSVDSCIFGFDEQQRLFLEESFENKRNFVPVKKSLCLINADKEKRTKILKEKLSDGIENFCLAGLGKNVLELQKILNGKDFFIRRYAMIPWDKPRLIIPLQSHYSISCGLRFHRPGRWLARGWVWIVEFLARFGSFSLLGRRMLLIATRDAGFVPIGVQAFNFFTCKPLIDVDYALYLGSPAEGRKTIALLLDHQKPVRVLKTGTTDGACLALKNEEEALLFLKHTPLSDNVPSWISSENSASSMLLVQEYRDRIRGDKYEIESAVVSFLAQLSKINRGERALIDMFSEVLPTSGMPNGGIAENYFNEILKEIRVKAAKRVKVWEHRSHGDFAPWNCSWTQKGLYVYDWEKSSERSLAFSDAFYYMIAPAVYVDGTIVDAGLLDRAKCFFNRIAEASGLRDLDFNVYLGTWIIRSQWGSAARPAKLDTLFRLVADLLKSFPEEAAATQNTVER